MATTHIPVLRDRCLDLLAPALTGQPGAVLVDGTLGLGGHAEAALTRFDDVHVVGIDRDPHALALARQRLAPFGDRFTGVQATFDQLGEVVSERNITAVRAVLLDLGVSSMQLDTPERGFAYSFDAPLDMRMDPQADTTAADILADYSAADLTRILRTYGEERYAPRIAQAIVSQRSDTPFTRTGELVALLDRVIPGKSKRTGGHPAKRTFQALRIEVNDELGCLTRALPEMMGLLPVGGRLVVMSFQSLEDRIVKRTFASATEPAVPPDLPVIPSDARPRFRRLTRGAEVASTPEITANPRAASVRLRAVERVEESP